MIAVKIILSILSVLFLGFGYFIFFLKNYNLINGFDENGENKEKAEAKARRIGLAEFIIGIVLFIFTVLLCIFA